MKSAFTILQKIKQPLIKTNNRAYSGGGSRYVYSKYVQGPAQTTAVLAGREWLPGARSDLCEYPKFLSSPRENLPAVYECTYSESPQNTLQDLASEAREILDDGLHVHGAILIRKLPLSNGATFSKFVNGLGYTMMGYEGGTAVRHVLYNHVLTASDDPPSYCIEPHNELSYAPLYPSKVFFYCEIPAQPGHGGESVMVDNRNVLPKINTDLIEKLRKVGLRYTRHLPQRHPEGYTSWQDAFFTEDKSQVEKLLNERGMHYKWDGDGALSYWYNLKAFITHPKTGEEVWFNHITGHHASYYKDHPSWAHLDIPDNKFPAHCYYGDGSEVEEETLQHVRNVTWNAAVGFQLQKGDIIAFDNIYVQHARLGFVGERKLLASLTKD
ncbi:dapdiamide synthesis protein DdaC-like [Glandiceps talaboti]